MSAPRTKAGRALLDGHSIECHMPDGHHRILTDGEGRKVVLAIEAEAAEPYRKALERLVDVHASEPNAYYDALDEARALLRREVGE